MTRPHGARPFSGERHALTRSMSLARPRQRPETGERPPATQPAKLLTVAIEWARIGVTGFGGPPAHIVLLRRLVVEERRWMEAHEFEDALAACNLLPGPSSTQLAIFCAYRSAGPLGAVVGGLGFIVPAVVLVIALSLLFLSRSRPLWVRGAGAGAGGAVAAVAVHAARGLIGSSVARIRDRRERIARWLVYLVAGIAGAALLGPYLVLVLVGAGLVELVMEHGPPGGSAARATSLGFLLPASITVGGIGSLVWVAFKVGALSFGGGFVIVPLMQGDAVHVYHWMTNQQFLNAVALGQVTPGPVVSTVAAVGYAAHGLGGGVLAAGVAFAPSFTFVLLGGRRFERLRADHRARAFLDGAGPAAIGAILGAAVLLAAALHETWQFAVLAAALVVLLLVRRGVVSVLIAAGAIGVVVALAGGPLPS